MFRTSHGLELTRAPIAALAAFAALTAGCMEQPGLAEVEETRSALASLTADELAQQIAAHPSYPELSTLADRDLSRVTATLAALPQQQGRAVLDSLIACNAQGDLATCQAILGNLGLMTAEDKLARAQASEAAARIATDLGLAQLPPVEVAAGFRGAQLASDGAGAGSAVVDLVLAQVNAPCGPECRESIGNGLGPTKGDYGATLAESSIGSSLISISGDDDGGGGDVGTIITIIKVAVDVAILLEKWIWNSGEEDKECTSDSDCPSNEFCHKTGENDCRPKLGLDALCTRGSQCASNCCKPHISSGFLPECRPADRC